MAGGLSSYASAFISLFFILYTKIIWWFFLGALVRLAMLRAQRDARDAQDTQDATLEAESAP